MTGFCLLWLISATSGAFAGGYAIPEQTARAASLANSVTAGVTDPSAVYVNPAALTEIQGNRIIGGGELYQYRKQHIQRRAEVGEQTR